MPYPWHFLLLDKRNLALSNFVKFCSESLTWAGYFCDWLWIVIPIIPIARSLYPMWAFSESFYFSYPFRVRLSVLLKIKFIRRLTRSRWSIFQKIFLFCLPPKINIFIFSLVDYVWYICLSEPSDSQDKKRDFRPSY